MQYGEFSPVTWRGALKVCDCAPGHSEEYLRQICRLSNDMATWTFPDFWNRDERGWEAAEAAVAALEQGYGWLTLHGPNGTGKSYLLAAAVNEARARGMSAIYICMAELLDELRKAIAYEHNFSKDASFAPYSSLWNHVKNARVLCLDELEKFKPTEWAEEKLFELVEWRYRNMYKLVTMFATNATVKEGCILLKGTRWPGYLESRIMDGRFQVVEVAGGDVRPGLRRADG